MPIHSAEGVMRVLGSLHPLGRDWSECCTPQSYSTPVGVGVEEFTSVLGIGRRLREGSEKGKETRGLACSNRPWV